MADHVSAQANVRGANVKGSLAPGRSQNVVAKTKAVL